jgi:hypothetical protein
MVGSKPKLALDEARGHAVAGDGDNHAVDEECWELTGEVFYMDCPCAGDATVDGDVARKESMIQAGKKNVVELQLHTHAGGATTDQGDEFLQRRVVELELQVKQMIKERKRMEKLHRIEMRARDKKEVGIVIVVAICAIIYGVVALMVSDNV